MTMKTAAALSCLTLLSAEASQGRTIRQGPRRRLDMEGAVTDAGDDSYATAWRYLGAYLDCGGSSGSSSGSFLSKFTDRCIYCHRRDLRRSTCKNPTRKLLWAAYRDPNYGGDEIGEYQFYDADDGAWDDSTCVGDRCAKMDCHDPYGSSWELMGVYKESVSFDDDNFFEQLFKHQGYCLWDGDKEDEEYDSQDAWDSDSDSMYQFMQAMRKELPEGCKQVSLNGGAYYIDMKPQSGGDMTLGVYKDSSCTQESQYTYEDYQNYMSSYLTASASSGAFDTWNSGMDAYKVCQPCRAYNREVVEDGDWEGARRDRRRWLTEYNDGQGDEEQNGYNCYDDAGYQNCNQCYKFETHTDMEEASAADLSQASSQGTILRIKYNGHWYGNGLVGDVTQGDEGKTEETTSSQTRYYGRSSSKQRKRKNYRSQYYRNRMSYSFAGATMMLALGAAVRVRRRTRGRGTLDDDIDSEGDTYVEMATPR